MTILAKNTPVKIDGTEDGMYRLETRDNTYYVDSSYRFLFDKLELEDNPEETVETWNDEKRWKGCCPCSNGVNAFNEGWGPWFLLPAALKVESKEEREQALLMSLE